MIEFNWEAGITSKEGLLTEPFKIEGILVDANVCKNKFRIDEPEFPNLEKQIAGSTLRVDHGKSVRDVVGGFNSAHWNTETKKMEFEAEIDDEQIQKMAKKGRIKYVSIGATADAYCSECNKPSGPLRSCKCKNAHDVIKNVKFKEGSIVLDPAYESAEWKPKDFMASLDSALNIQDLKVTPDSTAKAGEGGKQKNYVEDKKMSETNQTEIEGATKLKSAGPDAVILLAEQVSALKSELASLKAEKKAKEDEDKKKENSLSTKLDAILTKMESEKKKEPEDDEEDDKPKKTKKEWPKKKKDEDEDEDEKKEDDDDDEAKKEECSKCGKAKDDCTCKEKKKEAIRAGAKVEDAEIDASVQTEQVRYGVKVPNWIAEVVDKASKEGWFE